VQRYVRKPNERPVEMALLCVKCQGAAVPAAQMRTFEYKGKTLHCIEMLSSCMVCGHQWADDKYEAENSDHVDQARAALAID